MDDAVDKLAPLIGTQELSGIRSRNIARILLFFCLPIFLFATAISLSKMDLKNLSIFGTFTFVVMLVSGVLLHGRRRIKSFVCYATGITFLPMKLHIPVEEIDKIELFSNSNGGEIIVLSLNSRRFTPYYFGLVWCIGKSLVINTEPVEKA